MSDLHCICGSGCNKRINELQDDVDRLTAKLKQRDFQDEVLEETGRLLDKSRAEVDLLRKVHETSRYISRNSPNETWNAFVYACCAVEDYDSAKTTEKDDE